MRQESQCNQSLIFTIGGGGIKDASLPDALHQEITSIRNRFIDPQESVVTLREVFIAWKIFITWRRWNERCQPAKCRPPGSQTSNYKYGNRFIAAAQEICQKNASPHTCIAFNVLQLVRIFMLLWQTLQQQSLKIIPADIFQQKALFSPTVVRLAWINH